MSLDISLINKPETVKCNCEACGNEHTAIIRETVYNCNITHNLGTMADKASIYEALWSPDEIGITEAGQLVPLLEEGLKKLKAEPEYYKTFNAKNGWGLYEHFVPFVEKYLAACKEY